jgi:hypothetical protein
MRKRLYMGLVVFPVLLVSAIGFLAGPSSADPNLVDVPAHRHWQGDPANGVQIGPRLCDNPKLQKAFNQFHFNIHHSFIPVSAGGPAETGGVIDSLGPQDGAPGLNNDHGGEINATAIVVNGRGCGLPPGVTG